MQIEVVTPYQINGDFATCYNEYMKKAKEWVLFTNPNIIILQPEWYQMCINAINEVGLKAGWISTVTNRSSCPDQCRTPPGDHDNIIGHIQFSNGLYATNKNKIIEPKSGKSFSDFFILTHKKAWEDVGGFTNDTDYYNKLIKADYKTYIMPGIYCYNVDNRNQLYEKDTKSIIMYEKTMQEDEKLSVCMIMKDEEKHIKRCLESVKDIADEIIIVDTGSTDKSIEIAKSFGAKIYHHPWEDDFSLHRNQSIGYCTGDWLLFIDADEELLGDKHELKNWLKSVPDEFSAVSCTMKDMRNDSEKMQFAPSKIFRNGKIRYKNIVHNQPVYEGHNVFCKQIYYKHYGYDVDPKDRAEKTKRSLALLKKRLEINPEDYEAMFYISQMYGWLEEWHKMTDYAEAYLAAKPNIKTFDTSVYFSAIRIYLTQLNRPIDAKRWLDIAVAEMPNDLDIAFAACEFGVISKNIDLMARSANRYLDLYANFENTRSERGSHFTHSYCVESLTYCLFHLGSVQIGQGSMTYNRVAEALKEAPEAFQQQTLLNMRKYLNGVGLDFKNIEKIS